MATNNKPYLTLGQHLKKVREQAKRSVEEVSGAIEIDQPELQSIEAGVKRPDEDVMLLLISYFNMADYDALQLWKLAKYDSDLNEHLDLNQTGTDEQMMRELMSQKPVVMLLSSIDLRTMYSDGIEVSWNKSGLTMNFTQSNKDQAVTVAKIGMSHEQAETVIDCLQKAMLHVKYNNGNKLLPPPASDK
jgi:transcriptional regulator with XRE-family HTH domain